MAIMPFLAAIGSVSSVVPPFSPPLAEANFPDYIDPNVPNSRPYNVEEPQVIPIFKPTPEPDTSFSAKDLELMRGFMHPLQLWHLKTRDFIFKYVENSEKLHELDAKIQKAFTAYTGRDWENPSKQEHQAEPSKSEQQPPECNGV